MKHSDKIPVELHEKIIEIGKEVWHDCYDNREQGYVGELKKMKIEHEGKEYDLSIDCYWDRSNYFDYHLSGNGLKCSRLVARCM